MTDHDRAIDRVLATDESRSATIRRFGDRKAEALHEDDVATTDLGDGFDGDQLDREDRASLRRVPGLSTELADVTEVEYRQLRIENVVLIGVYNRDVEDAENSLRELAALAETAGAVVLDGMLQRRPHPDPATYLGRGKVEELAHIVAEPRGRHGHRRHRARSQPAACARRQGEGQGDRPHGRDPRHLQPARQEPRGPGPGRTRATRVPAAASARLG